MVEVSKSECDSFVILKTLGAGGFGIVKKAEDKTNKNLAALKILLWDEYSDEFAKEAAILQLLKHQNITEIYKVIPKAKYKKKNGTILERNVIAMEYVEGGSLFNYLYATIKLNGRGFTEPTIRRLFHQMVDALEYCHKSKIVHRDLKPENILLDSEFNIKLADFGLATIIDKEKHTTPSGTEGYQAPEMFSQKEHEPEPADIFVLGIMLFMMKSGHPPFQEATPGDSIYKWIFTGMVENFWKGHIITKQAKFGKDFYSEDFKTLCSNLLHPDPQLRYKFEDIKASKWYNGEIADKETAVKEFTTYLEDVKQQNEKEKKERKDQKMESSGRLGEPDGDGDRVFDGVRETRTATASSIEDELQKFGINLGDKKRKITTKEREGIQTSFELVSEDLELLFRCVALTAAEVLDKPEISSKRYKIIGSFSLLASKLDTTGAEKSSEEEVSGKITIVLHKKPSEENEYVISFSKMEGNYFRFLQFIEHIFMKELKKLPW